MNSRVSGSTTLVPANATRLTLRARKSPCYRFLQEAHV